MNTGITRPLAGLFLAVALAACGGDQPFTLDRSEATFGRAEAQVIAIETWYGEAVPVGGGTVRAYVISSSLSGPVEIGVAISGTALANPPAGDEHLHLALPRGAPEPYEFVMFGWNQEGHEPEGVYDIPHFDFHFYATSHHEVAAIVPTDPAYREKANDLPGGDLVPEHYIALAPPGGEPADAAVPEMGVHWLDTRSPELQGILGNQTGYRPFTKTFIYGSWDGEVTFFEPMITREYLLSRPDKIVPIPQPAYYREPGWYPSSYRIAYVAEADEYRIGLTGLNLYD